MMDPDFHSTASVISNNEDVNDILADVLNSERFLEAKRNPPIKTSMSENNFPGCQNNNATGGSFGVRLSDSTRDRLRRSVVLRRNLTDNNQICFPSSFSDSVLGTLEGGVGYAENLDAQNYVLDWTATNDDVLSNHSNSTYELLVKFVRAKVTKKNKKS